MDVRDGEPLERARPRGTAAQRFGVRARVVGARFMERKIKAYLGGSPPVFGGAARSSEGACSPAAPRGVQGTAL